MSDHYFTTADALDSALSAYIADALASDAATYGQATLVVSGGSTPKGLFKQLSKTTIDWSAVTILLADDRWVPLDHEDSNEAMVRQTLLTDNATKANFISLVADYPDVPTNLARVEATVAALPCFSVVILGMGGDMHTASLFACSAELAEGLTTSDAVLMTHPTTAPHARVSLSKDRLLRTQRGLLHIVGDDKQQVLELARNAGSEQIAPISAFVTPNNSFEVWWAPKP